MIKALSCSFAQKVAVAMTNNRLEKSYKVTIEGIEFDLVFQSIENDVVRFSLFLPGHIYSRKTLKISCRSGNFGPEKLGIIPDSDISEYDPKIHALVTGMIILAVMEQLDAQIG
ncbi:MAG TPA: hypothetical protein P5328_02055 [Candidatus Paceibacterota bacterium]|nr:hypothetical protein [Candidatus Paceibacterota bacterium]HRZ34464.1 hypothetical protein [Candidatus Paceibacterota bacterium]